MTLSEGTTGIGEQIVSLLDGAGGGGDLSPVIPRSASPETVNSFTAADLTSAASSAATTVQQTLSSAASSLSTTAQNVWAKVTGGTPSATGTPIVTPVVVKTAAADNSMLWLWLLVGALAAYFGYREFFAKGGKSKSFFKSAASGSHVKRYGKG